MRLASLELPNISHVISANQGNHGFKYTINNETFLPTIVSGNYEYWKLTEAFNDVSGGALEIIARQIECEISIIADNEDVWIDYNRITTRGHVDFIVNNRYMAPSCNTLINEGLCVGKCWRYGHDTN